MPLGLNAIAAHPGLLAEIPGSGYWLYCTRTSAHVWDIHVTELEGPRCRLVKAGATSSDVKRLVRAVTGRELIIVGKHPSLIALSARLRCLLKSKKTTKRI